MMERLESRLLFSTPLAPSDVAPTVTPSLDVKVTWQNNLPHQQGFYISRAERGADGRPGRFIPIGRVGPSVRSFIDMAPLAGHYYFYVVKSFDSFYVLNSKPAGILVAQPVYSQAFIPPKFSIIPIKREPLDILV